MAEHYTSGLVFFANFDSGNIGRVERVVRPAEVEVEAEEDNANASVADPSPRRPSLPEFSVWTKADCAGTPFENGNRTWFYFGIRRQTPAERELRRRRRRAAPFPDDEDDDEEEEDESVGLLGPQTLQLHVRNLNKQSKLFSQGMSPLTLTVPLSKSSPPLAPPLKAQHQWERLRERPTYQTEDHSLSFKVKLDPQAVTYVAFTYPYTYRELQTHLKMIDKKYGTSHLDYANLSARPDHSIYFHRENACYSMHRRRVDLLTVTSVNGILPERESHLDGLFPSNADNAADKVGQPSVGRPFTFRHKPTVFVSARVHPGETQASFIMNGFLRFLLREQDPRAVTLRKKYVFKLLPMLNPDGVVSGHYRTDMRGVNLNRVYAQPSPELHPPIHAAKKLLQYAHFGYSLPEERVEVVETTAKEAANKEDVILHDDDDALPPPEVLIQDLPSTSSATSTSHWLRSTTSSPVQFPPPPPLPSPSESPSKPTPPSLPSSSTSDLNPTGWYEMTETSRCSEGDESIADFSSSVPSDGIGLAIGASAARSASDFLFPTPTSSVGTSSSSFSGPTSFSGAFPSRLQSTPKKDTTLPSPTNASSRSVRRKLNSNEDVGDAGSQGHLVNCEAKRQDFLAPKTVEVVTDQDSDKIAEKLAQTLQQQQQKHVPLNGKSGLFLYMDVHGHASKRGIFLYGNHFTDLDSKVDSMLLPKLMSMNCANFDFPACNFTERNMYLKDRHTGAGREGCGRVSAFKSTGIVYAYTLEANFNTGRVVNTVSAASRDSGRATPPPVYDTPPKYDTAVYEDAGKAMAISILDMTESNPWTRLTCSPCKNLKGVKEAIRKHIKQCEENTKQKSVTVGADGTLSSACSTRASRRTRTRTRTLSTQSNNSTGSASTPAAVPVTTRRKQKSLKSAKHAGSAAAAAPNQSPLQPPLPAGVSTSPASPDTTTYKPMAKLARKNQVSAGKNSQTGGKSLQLPYGPGAGANVATDKGLVRRSKSISGPVSSSSFASLVAESLDKSSAAVVAAAAKVAVQTTKTKLHLTRSRSNPGSRPSSPTRRLLMPNSASKVVKKKKKIGALTKKKRATSSSSSRRSSLTATTVSAAVASLPTAAASSAVTTTTATTSDSSSIVDLMAISQKKKKKKQKTGKRNKVTKL